MARKYGARPALDSFVHVQFTENNSASATAHASVFEPSGSVATHVPPPAAHTSSQCWPSAPSRQTTPLFPQEASARGASGGAGGGWSGEGGSGGGEGGTHRQTQRRVSLQSTPPEAVLYLYTASAPGFAQQCCGRLLLFCWPTVAPCPYSAVTACSQSLCVVTGEQPLSAAQPAPLVIADH